MEELEGNGQAAYSEGITDTIQVFPLIIHSRVCGTSNKLTFIGEVGR